MTSPRSGRRYSFSSSSQKEHLGNVDDFRVRSISSARSGPSYSFYNQYVTNITINEVGEHSR